MSTTNVETEVVQMRFDNKNFEKNVQQTMDSVDKLKKELNFDAESKSFQKLEENTKKVSFNPLTEGLEKVRASFSLLDTFSFTVYRRLSNRLIDLSEKIVKSASTEGIKSGFNEYELKMNSFKAIQASAGKEFSDAKINEYLEELNKYADKTIYSFSDMTNNIGKFTNAGVKLDVAVKAIKGISNEAAVSGANAAEASRAMYNFSQALSAGYVKLIDWKSIENANMATEEFKTQLLETAASLNKVKKNADGTYKTLTKGTVLTATKNFNDSLSEQWMTTEVLTKTLEKYADETTEIGKKAFEAAQQVNTFSKMIDTLKESIQSGWAQVWEILIGDLKTATALWTGLSNAIGGVIDKFFTEKKAILQLWKEAGGLDRTIQALKDIFAGLGRVLDSVKAAWYAVFPRKSTDEKARGLMHLTVAFENLAKKLQPGSLLLKKITSTFKGLFSAISIVKEAFVAFYNTFGKFVLRVLKDAVGALFDVSGGFGEMLYKVNRSVKENQTFYKTFKAIVDVLEWVYSGVKKVASVLWDFVKTIKEAIGESGGFTAFKDWFGGLKDAVKNFDIGGIGDAIVSMFKGIWHIIDKTLEKTFNFYKPLKDKMAQFKTDLVNSKFGQWIIEFYHKIVEGVQKVFDSFRDVKTDGIDDMNEKTQNKLGIFSKIINFFKKVWEVIKNIATTIWPYIKEFVKSIGTGIQMLWSGVTENIKNSDLGDAGGLLAGAGVLGIAQAIKSFVNTIKPIFQGFKVLSSGGALKSIFSILENASKLIKANIIKQIAVSLLMLTAAIFLLCTIPKDKLVLAVGAMGVLFQGITSVFNSVEGGTNELTGKEGEAKGKEAAKESAAIAGRLMGVAAMLIGLSVAMVVLTIALKKIAGLDVEALTKGVIVLGILFKFITSTVSSILQIGKFSKTMGSVEIQAKGVGNMIKSLGKAMIYIMAAVWILVHLYETAEDPNNVTKAVVVIGVLIGLVGAIMTLIAKFSKESTSKSLNVKSVKINAGVFAAAFVIKEFALALVGILAAIALISLATSKGMIKQEHLGTTLSVLLGVTVMILGTMAAMIALAKWADAGNVGKIAALVGVITLFLFAMTNMITALSILPSDWAFTATSVISGVALSLAAIFAAMGYLLKGSAKTKLKTKDIVAIFTVITAAIVVITTAMAGLAYAVDDAGKLWGVIGVVAAISVALAGLVYAFGKSKTMATGAAVFAGVLNDVATAAAALAVALFFIFQTLDDVSKVSDERFDKMSENIRKFGNVLEDSTDTLIKIAVNLVTILIEQAVNAAFMAILTGAKSIIEGLEEVLDILLDRVPELVNKLIQVAVEILSQLERRMGPLVAQIVSFIATLISQIAQAILDNSDKIVNAIDSVITAISTIVVKSVAKLLGLSEFKTAVNTLIKILKPVAAALLAMFAVKKVKGALNVVIKLLDVFKGRIKAFSKGLKNGGIGNGWKEMLGINQLNQNWEYLRTKMKSEYTSLGERMKFGAKTIAGALTVGAAIGLALGSLVKSFIDAKTESLNAVDTLAAETNTKIRDLENALMTSIKENAKFMQDYQNEMLGVDTKYNTNKEKLKRLFDLIDMSTGRIKEGKEDEVTSLVEELNSELGNRLVLENQILKVIDEQGNKRKADLDYLLKINDAERLKDKIAQSADEEEEITKKGGKLDTAKQNLESASQQYAIEQQKRKNFNEQLIRLKAEADELDKIGEELGYSSTEYKTKQHDFLNKLYKMDDLYGIHLNGTDLESTYNKKQLDEIDRDLAKKEDNARLVVEGYQAEVNRWSRFLQNLYNARKALESGDADLIKKSNSILNYLYNPQYSTAQAEAEIEQIKKDIEAGIKDVATSIPERLEGEYEAALLYYQDLGKDSGELTKLYEEYTKKREAEYGKIEDGLKKGVRTASEETEAKGVLSGLISKGISGNWSSDKIKSEASKLGVDDLLTEDTLKQYGNKVNVFKDYASGAMGAAGLAGGEAYGNAFVDAMTALFTDNDEVSPIINKFFNGSIAEGLIEQLQSSILPAIASLTGQSNLLGGLFPVNFGGIQNGSGLFGVANAPAMSFATPLPYQDTLNNINTSLNKLTEKMVEQTTGITNEIKGLRSDVVDLGSRIDDMEVLLDGDALVGRLTPRINNALVTYSYRAGRGV